MDNQAYSFIVFILNGILIGLLFDIFRILRKSFKTPDFITYIEDILFWILTGIITLYFIFIFNNRRNTFIYFFRNFVRDYYVYADIKQVLYFN